MVEDCSANISYVSFTTKSYSLLKLFLGDSYLVNVSQQQDVGS